MHIDDLKRFALLWLHKTEEVRADTAHWSRNITGDIYEAGWISEMYGYSFGAAELNLRHIISNEILIYPGYVPVPGVKYKVFHYGLEFSVGNWSFDKANWRNVDLVNKCWAKFPDPPDPYTLDRTDEDALQRDLLSIECGNALNEALHLHHEKRRCTDPASISSPIRKSPGSISLSPPNQETVGGITTSRKFGNIEEISTLRRSPSLKNESQESSPPAMTNETFTSMRLWIIGLWAFSIVVFVTVMSVMLSHRKGQKKRGKSYKTKRRASHSGFRDMNGNDRHLRSSEIHKEFSPGILRLIDT